MKKKILIILLIVIMAVLFIPRKVNYKYDETVEYKALTYSIIKHSPISKYPPGISGQLGTEIKIFGITVYDDTVLMIE